MKQQDGKNAREDLFKFYKFYSSAFVSVVKRPKHKTYISLLTSMEVN